MFTEDFAKKDESHHLLLWTVTQAELNKNHRAILWEIRTHEHWLVPIEDDYSHWWASLGWCEQKYFFLMFGLLSMKELTALIAKIRSSVAGDDWICSSWEGVFNWWRLWVVYGVESCLMISHLLGWKIFFIYRNLRFAFFRWAANAPAVSVEPSPMAAARCRGKSCWTKRGWVCTSALCAMWPTRSCPVRRTGAGTSTRTASVLRRSSSQLSPLSRWGMTSSVILSWQKLVIHSLVNLLGTPGQHLMRAIWLVS